MTTDNEEVEETIFVFGYAERTYPGKPVDMSVTLYLMKDGTVRWKMVE